MRKLLFAAALLLPLAAQAQPAQGVYNVTGTNPDGTPYTGLLAVAPRGGGTFQVEWNVAGQRIPGWGMGAADAFAASYVLEGKVGVVLYRRQGDGWRGIWSVANGPAGREDLTPR
jgi:hypothetical protein